VEVTFRAELYAMQTHTSIQINTKLFEDHHGCYMHYAYLKGEKVLGAWK